jgi:hypothetical protein
MVGLNARCEFARRRREIRAASMRVGRAAILCANDARSLESETRESINSTAQVCRNHNMLCGGKGSKGHPPQILEVRMGTLRTRSRVLLSFRTRCRAFLSFRTRSRVLRGGRGFCESEFKFQDDAAKRNRWTRFSARSCSWMAGGHDDGVRHEIPHTRGDPTPHFLQNNYVARRPVRTATALANSGGSPILSRIRAVCCPHPIACAN